MPVAELVGNPAGNGAGRTPATILELAGVTKQFPGQLALDDVSLVVRASEIHALIGQNGSGKSTLIKLLSGFHQPTDVERAAFLGAAFQLGDPRAFDDAGVRFVHQDLALVDSLSVLENFAMSVGYLVGGLRRIDWRAERERARTALEEFGFGRPVTTVVQDLSAAERTDVAIARAAFGGADRTRLLVLDEPTASLARGEVERLFSKLRRLRDNGISIIFVSHHLEEVVELADHVTVLRDGRVVASQPMRGLAVSHLADLMVGATVDRVTRSPESSRAGGDCRLRAADVGGETVRSFDLDLRRGSIVGVAGLDGSGREAIIGLLTGRLTRTGGTVEVDGVEVRSYDPRHALALGLASVPNDRQRNGLIPTMDLRENITIADLGTHVRRGWLSHRSEHREASRWIGDLGVRTTGSSAAISSLSGGNQQKVLIARALRLAPAVLLLDEPTHGVDVGAKAEIHRLIQQSSEGGTAVLMSSSDSEELASVCDRVLVFYRGEIVTELSAKDGSLSPDAINRAQLAAVR